MAMARAAAAKKVAKLGLNGNCISGKCVAAIRAGLKDALGSEDVLGGCVSGDRQAPERHCYDGRRGMCSSVHSLFCALRRLWGLFLLTPPHTIFCSG